MSAQMSFTLRTPAGLEVMPADTPEGLFGPPNTLSAVVGLIPALTGARRLNCLGLLLVPALLNMAGVGSIAAGWLGLL